MLHSKFFVMTLLASLWLLIASAAAAPPSKTSGNANTFWHQFREAIVNDQEDKLLNMTHFPFEVRGVDDSIPIKRYRRQNFPQILRRILEQPVMLPSNAHYVETTVFKIIKEKPHLTKKDYLTPYFIRVEQLEFQRVKGQWLLTGGYLEE